MLGTHFLLRSLREMGRNDLAFSITATVGDITWVKCSYDSIHGRIVSNWKRDGTKLAMEVTIPINTTATVYVPAKDEAGVTESGKPAEKAAGVKFLRMENGAAVYEVKSGYYSFKSDKFNVAPFFTRWLTTICEDGQMEDGSMPSTAPTIGMGSGATAWGDASLICTYNIYRSYGDTRVISARFASLERLMKWYASKSKDNIAKVGGWGDWLNLGASATSEVIDTAYYAHLAGLMAEMAKAIGNDEAATRYAKQHNDIKTAFAGIFCRGILPQAEAQVPPRRKPPGPGLLIS